MAPYGSVTPSDVVPREPLEGPGGAPIYDGVGDVVQITVTCSSQSVWSVQAKYQQKTANVFDAALHGTKGPQVAEIKLDFNRGEQMDFSRGEGSGDKSGDIATISLNSPSVIVASRDPSIKMIASSVIVASSDPSIERVAPSVIMASSDPSIEVDAPTVIVDSSDPSIAMAAPSVIVVFSDPSIEVAAPSESVTPSDVVPQGPFGGPGGTSFYDGVGDVVQITVTYSSQSVWSVQAKYQQKTANVFDAALHGTKGPQVAEIKLDFNHGERLMQVKGTTAPVGDVANDVITSLTFVTTERSYGPYGAVVGRPFESSPLGCKVVGFFGRAAWLLDSFGTFTEFSASDTNLIPDGPWGGNGGSAYYDAPADKIQQIDVEYDSSAIISLNVTYDRGSQGFKPSKHGGDGHSKGTIETIVFGDDEYLAQVKGTTGLAYAGLTLVTSVCFISNKTVYGPFGNVSGDQFETRPDVQILGFYGRSGWSLDQLGALVGRAPSHSMVEIAHFGGSGGGAFYEGRGEISQIEVTYLKGQLVAKLQVTYLQGDEQFVGALHGEGNGGESGDIATISLNSPDEYLVQVKGTHGSAEGIEDLILSIEFITNKKTYGPYGNPSSGAPFASRDAGLIVGLFGRSGWFIDQIGVICFANS